MYYLTIEKNGKAVCSRVPFDDYSAALLICSEYYKPRAKRSVLTFTTEVINGQFVRSYAELNRPEDIYLSDEISKARYAVAAKHSNSFDYKNSLFFLIESELGIEDVGD